MRRAIRAAVASVLLASAVLFGFSTPAHATTCGDTAAKWVPTLLASTWDVEAFINGNPQTSVVVLTYSGQLAVTTVVDPLSVNQGQYAHIPANAELDWYAVDLPNSGDRLTYFATALTCDSNSKVLTAGGPVVQYNVGQVGIFYMTRVV